MSFITKECNLFQSVNFTSHSCKKLNWKIECDGISNEEWVTIAEMIYEFEPRNFRDVEGIPRGGKKLEEKLKGYATGNEHDPLLIVDDVMTTGSSFEEYYLERLGGKPTTDPEVRAGFFGWTVFARGSGPKWVSSLFTMPIKL